MTHAKTPYWFVSDVQTLSNKPECTAIGRALSRAIITLNDNEILKQFALLCAAGLFVSLLMLTYGVDLSPGFF